MRAQTASAAASLRSRRLQSTGTSAQLARQRAAAIRSARPATTPATSRRRFLASRSKTVSRYQAARPTMYRPRGPRPVRPPPGISRPAPQPESRPVQVRRHTPTRSYSAELALARARQRARERKAAVVPTRRPTPTPAPRRPSRPATGRVTALPTPIRPPSPPAGRSFTFGVPPVGAQVGSRSVTVPGRGITITPTTTTTPLPGPLGAPPAPPAQMGSGTLTRAQKLELLRIIIAAEIARQQGG